MIEILISGKFGKTRKLMKLAQQEIDKGGKVLYVSPNMVSSEIAVDAYFKGDKKPDFTCSELMAKKVTGNTYTMILLDGTAFYGESLMNGSNLAIAKNRLRHITNSVVAYTSENPSLRWVSVSVWYKPWTWWNGYWL